MSAEDIIFAQNDFFIQYQQEKLMLIDEEGDRILLQLFKDTCETGVKKVITRSNVSPQETQLRKPRFWQENPIVINNSDRVINNTQLKPLYDEDKLYAQIKSVIKDKKNGQKLSRGEKHIWKKSLVPSKIVVALATATSSRFMYVGQEIPLIEWIKRHPDNSITVEDLFRESYILNQGNVYLTIVTIENVLSDATFEENREYTIVNQKLVDLYEQSPNKFGDWYHFFGTMLAGYTGEQAEIIADMYTVYRRISRGKNAEKSTMDADTTGAKIGMKLKNFVDEEIDGKLRTLIKKIIVSLDHVSKVKSIDGI
ncbi:MAG: hypothetical protein J5594_05980 [Elusimicrobiaceae bacterium]|nr:hypothetical protein [Elusimicrobiaceae bacterium]